MTVSPSGSPSSPPSDQTRVKLVRMVNQIAGFFATQTGADQEAEVADHIRTFWDPSMQAHLAQIVAAGGDGLTPLALAGARRLAA